MILNAAMPWMWIFGLCGRDDASKAIYLFFLSLSHSLSFSPLTSPLLQPFKAIHRHFCHVHFSHCHIYGNIVIKHIYLDIIIILCCE